MIKDVFIIWYKKIFHPFKDILHNPTKIVTILIYGVSDVNNGSRNSKLLFYNIYNFKSQVDDSLFGKNIKSHYIVMLIMFGIKIKIFFFPK